MDLMRAAAIDIGTNTILMVIGEKFPDGSISILKDEHSIARLGEGLDKTGVINPDALQRAVSILQNYKTICSEFNVENVSLIGTSAMREAKNKSYVSNEIYKIFDKQVDIVSGEEEAGLSFSGAVEFENFADKQNLVIDIGGGSTEFITGFGTEVKFNKSLPVGSVKLTERYFNNHPPAKNSIEAAIENLRHYLTGIDKELFTGKFFGVAGTATTIAAVFMKLHDFEIDKVHGKIIKLYEIEKIFEQFCQSEIRQIIEELHVNPKRADLITAGTLILIESMRHLKKEEITISSRGLRFGILYKMFKSIF